MDSNQNNMRHRSPRGSLYDNQKQIRSVALFNSVYFLLSFLLILISSVSEDWFQNGGLLSERTPGMKQSEKRIIFGLLLFALGCTLVACALTLSYSMLLVRHRRNMKILSVAGSTVGIISFTVMISVMLYTSLKHENVLQRKFAFVFAVIATILSFLGSASTTITTVLAMRESESFINRPCPDDDIRETTLLSMHV